MRTVPVGRVRRAIGLAVAGFALFAPFGVNSNAWAGTGQILPAGTGEVVPDSYVVVFNDTVSGDQVPARTAALAARFGGRPGHVFRTAVHGFEVSLPEPAARLLAADPSVAYVQRNGIYHIASTETPAPSWGLDRTDQRTLPLDNAYTFPTLAQGVKAYVIDTGIRL